MLDAVLGILKRDFSTYPVHVAAELHITWDEAKRLLLRLKELGLADSHRNGRFWDPNFKYNVTMPVEGEAKATR